MKRNRWYTAAHHASAFDCVRTFPDGSEFASVYQETPTGSNVVALSTWHDDVPGARESSVSRAHLIAAAPCLLEALEQTLDYAISHACDARGISTYEAEEAEDWAWVKAARAAIAKAQGGA